MGRMGGHESENTPLECMVKNLKKGFNGDYELTPNKFKALCEVDWPFLCRVARGRVTTQICG
jgi:hypothetical protein